MIGVLWRHHPCLTPTSAKWFGMATGMAMLWTGMVTADISRVREGAPTSWTMFSMVWLVVATYTAWGPFHERAREFALRSPVAGRRLWDIHAVTVLLAGLVMMLIAFGPSSWFVAWAASRKPELDAVFGPVVAQLPMIWLHGLVWLFWMVGVTVSDRPHVATIARDRRWFARQTTALVVAAAGVILAPPALGHGILVLPVVSATAMVVWARRRVPASLVLASHELRPAGRQFGAGATSTPLPIWRRPPLWSVVLTCTSKHPLVLLTSIPFLPMFGFWLSPASAAVFDDLDMTVLFLPMAAYMLFAFAAAPLLRIGTLDHLPISRDRLLAIMLVPQLVLYAGGFIGGTIWARDHGETTGEPLIFVNEEENYGLRTHAEFFRLAWDSVPAQTAPDGTVIQPPDDWRVPWLPSLILYKPYHTPPGVSLEVAAWQLSRASEQVFGTRIGADVFRDRHLTVDPDGRVITRDPDGLKLRENHPELRSRRFPAIAALQALIAGGLFQIGYGVYLGFFRPRWSSRARGRAFIGVMAGLMGLYMLQFGLAIAQWLDLDQSTALLYILADMGSRQLPGGVVTAWAITLAILASGHWLLQRRFRRAEWPVSGQDDMLVDAFTH